MTEEVAFYYNKISFEYATASSGTDSFDFTSKEEKQEVGMLLPAVQAAREAAAEVTDQQSWRDLLAEAEDIGAAPGA